MRHSLLILACLVGLCLATTYTYPSRYASRYVIWSGGDSNTTRTDSFAASVGFVNRTATAFRDSGLGDAVINIILPPGKLMQWYGDSTAWPSGSVATGGWVLCNGSRYYKDINDTLAGDSTLTPDFRNRFIVGANGDSAGRPSSTIDGVEHTTGGSTAYTPVGAISAHSTTYPPPHWMADVSVLGLSYADHTFTGTLDTLVPPYRAAWLFIKSREF